ncbi:MAG TPA: enoyl-CoA hydratase/isomerase family protein [Acidimicrobiales bacterium]|nr:enoyl-CoA hydratase/isomerase family protein [Acidimicrobiales bacterium]
MTTPDPIGLDDLVALLGAASAPGPPPGPGTSPLVVVDLDVPGVAVPRVDTGFTRVVVGITSRPRPEAHPAAPACDLVLGRGGDAVAAVASTVAAHPLAATALVLLLRGSERRTVDEGLHAESAVYSTLQAGPELAAWRAARPPRARDRRGDPVTLGRRGGRLEVVLARPDVHNALDRTMRDQLVDAFRLVAADPSITEVHLRGAGPSFCAGGDLDEFGTFPDPATAHLVRLQQSAGRAVHAVADRVTAHLHGACMGSGIELAAFAGTVLAGSTTSIGLPEVGLGLVPGAGGTVSLPRRIGRHRTARLALTGERIDAATALGWGLVDGLEAAPAGAPPAGAPGP